MTTKEIKKIPLGYIIVGLIILFIGSLIGMGFFESYVKSLPYFVALYNVLEGLIKGIWQIISTSTVFIPLLILFILLRYKDSIIEIINKILPRLKKAGIAGASVELDTERILENFASNNENTSAPNTIVIQKTG